MLIHFICLNLSFTCWLQSQIEPSFFSRSGAVADASLRREVGRIIDRGNAWLIGHQNASGSWGQEESVAATALCLLALEKDPEEFHANKKAAVLGLARDWLKSRVMDFLHGEGAIRLSCLEAAVILQAWGENPQADFEVPLKRLRAELILLVQNKSERGLTDGHRKTVFDGDGLEADLDAWIIVHLMEALCQFSPMHGTSCEPDLESFESMLAMHGGINHSATSVVGHLLRLLGYAYVGENLNQKQPIHSVQWVADQRILKRGRDELWEDRMASLFLLAKLCLVSKETAFKLFPEQSISWQKQLVMRVMDFQEPDGSWKSTGSVLGQGAPVWATCYAVMTLELLYASL